MKTFPSLWFLVTCLVVVIALFTFTTCRTKQNSTGSFSTYDTLTKIWHAPDTAMLSSIEEGSLIRYGRELIVNTSKYLGPKGMVAHISNGMNCQNCHINAGTLPFGNAFSAVASTYPKFRERSGKVESIEFRVNECMERSLNGSRLDSNSNEMRAMVAYLKWLGNGVPKEVKPKGAGTEELKFLAVRADTAKGRVVYTANCQRCHGKNGEGVLADDSVVYVYPPLWGSHSYAMSAGMYRLTRLSGFVKNNMPFGTTYQKPLLTDEEAWNVSAFINSQPRPQKLFSYDWPDINKKPVDYPFGPYTDGFSEEQHKYGPFGPIKKSKEEKHK
jgi:thiosulfate dehydrogenase